MSDNIITPEFRATFVGLFRASAPLENPNGEKKFSIRAAFPPKADLKALKAAVQAVAADKWGKVIPKTLRSPFRTNAELDKPVPGLGDDWIIATFSANEKFGRPGLVDEDLQDIIDESQAYSGAWYRAQVRPFAYDTAGNKGVALGLQNVQKLRDDEPIGSGRVAASKIFQSVGKSGSGSANEIFE
jgi:hypothetical protein